MDLTEPGYDVTHWALSFLYLALAVVVLFGMLRLRLSAARQALRFGLNLCFYLCVFVGAICRFFYFIAIVGFREDWWSADHLALFALIDVPTLFFLTAYSIVLFYWADLYHSKRQSRIFSTDVLLGIGIAVNTIAYVLCLVFLWIDVFVFTNQAGVSSRDIDGAATLTWAEQGVNIIITLFYVAFSIAYLVYGWQAVSLFREVPAVTPERRAVLRRLILMVTTIPLCFFIRTPITFIGMFWSFSSLWWFDLPYYGLLEILPLLIMMYVLLYRPQS